MVTGELTDTSGSRLAGLSDSIADAVERIGPATVRVDAREGLGGSGFVWAADGVIVTAAHVVEREEEILVGLPDGSELSAELVGRERSCDLALLKIERQGLVAPVLAPDGTLRVGNLVIAVGRPDQGGTAASMGIVSALGGQRRIRDNDPVEGYVWTDVGMYPGFSGGPLIDARGRVVGMNSSGLGSIANMALPVAALGRAVGELLSGAKEDRRESSEAKREDASDPVMRQAFLGLRTEEMGLPRSLAQQMGLQGGLFVMVVGPDSPAAEAGIKPGDIMVALGGQSVSELAELQALLTPDRIGATLAAVVLRGDEVLELDVTIGERR